MGAGEFPAGFGPAGLDPLPPIPPPRGVQPPAALYFDGATVDFPLDAHGFYQGIDPVDQEVALALIVRLGTVGSVPALGAAFRNIKRITPATKATAESMARAALATLVQARKIRIDSIAVETDSQVGAVAVAVSYVRLTTATAVPTVIKLNVNG